MVYRLPPLNALRLFEAAGRHLSFKAAAQELNVTPSAVSHAVQGLEDWLGVPLFVRGHRSLALTGAGESYLPEVRTALAHLARATRDLPGRRPAGHLVVSAAPTFALCWLVPALDRFRDRHGDIEVTLDTSRRLMDLQRDGVDVAIRMGTGGWTGVDCDLLVRERLVPVCAPSLVPSLQTPGDLADVPLLHVVGVAEDWGAWARARGASGLDVTRGPRFDTLQMAWEAAARGQGVALGRLPLVERDLAAGRLCSVLEPAVAAETGYWLVTDPDTLRPEAQAFRDWLRAELAA
ncbi:transcriptional regulator GcvA [Aquabacter cavernae]|uniref:transcriptional regulator GcvA n=1 Tax=Aquabacter cavernae TaxID=2496029 RepID=UPI000F8D644E|nr:transcriptional regulator GcvA [Aquabacter cavernae]